MGFKYVNETTDDKPKYAKPISDQNVGIVREGTIFF